MLPIDGHAQTLKSGALSPPRRVRSELVILNTAGTSWSSSTPGAEVRRDESTLTDALVVIAHTCPPTAPRTLSQVHTRDYLAGSKRPWMLVTPTVQAAHAGVRRMLRRRLYARFDGQLSVCSRGCCRKCG